MVCHAITYFVHEYKLSLSSSFYTILQNDLFNQDVTLKTYDFTKNDMHRRDVVEGRLREFYLKDKKDGIILKWIVVEW